MPDPTSRQLLGAGRNLVALNFAAATHPGEGFSLAPGRKKNISPALPLSTPALKTTPCMTFTV